MNQSPNFINYNNPINPSNSSYINKDELNISNMSHFNQMPIKQSANYQKKDFCQEHGEEITYLCFDCLSKCICSECVVHGIHKNHEVINTKKAYPIICEKANELLNHVGDKVKDLSAADRTLELKRNEILAISERCKRDIQNAFEEMRNKLNRKEKEIYDKTDLSVQDNIQELNTYSRILQSKIISLNKTIDSIQTRLMRKDELGLINFYCENKNKILTNSEITELDNMPDLGTISNLNVNIDKSSFEEMVNSLNAIHFEITSMKGIGMTQQESAYKYSVRRNLYGTNAIQSTCNSTSSTNNPVISGNNAMMMKPNTNNLNSSISSQMYYQNIPSYNQKVS